MTRDSGRKSALIFIGIARFIILSQLFMNFLQNGNETQVNLGSYKNLWSLECMAGIINTQSYGLAMDLYSFTKYIIEYSVYCFQSMS